MQEATSGINDGLVGSDPRRGRHVSSSLSMARCSSSSHFRQRSSSCASSCCSFACWRCVACSICIAVPCSMLLSSSLCRRPRQLGVPATRRRPRLDPPRAHARTPAPCARLSDPPDMNAPHTLRNEPWNTQRSCAKKSVHLRRQRVFQTQLRLARSASATAI